MQTLVESPEALKRIAAELIVENPAKIWLLYGELGAGKTTFTQGLAEHFGTDPADVKSPTFAIFQEYPNWVHYDTYRVGGLDVFLRAGLEEQLQQGKSIVLEWPETCEDFFKSQPHAEVRLEHHLEGRMLTVTFVP